MAIFNSYVTNYQRVQLVKAWLALPQPTAGILCPPNGSGDTEPPEPFEKNALTL